ncbi:hypothetical protein ACFQ4K_31180 [Tistrella bauzanensis]
MSNASAPHGFVALPPYHVIRDFLGPDLVARLLAHADANQDAFIPTGVGEGRIDPEIRVSVLLWDFGSLRDVLAERFRIVMDQVVAELRLSSFELARLEMELAAHGDGAFYRRHIDIPTGVADKKGMSRSLLKKGERRCSP